MNPVVAVKNVHLYRISSHLVILELGSEFIMKYTNPTKNAMKRTKAPYASFGHGNSALVQNRAAAKMAKMPAIAQAKMPNIYIAIFFVFSFIILPTNATLRGAFLATLSSVFVRNHVFSFIILA